MLILGLLVAGGIGAVTRYLVDVAVRRRVESSMPLGTMFINVTGSFVLGVLTGLALYHAFSSTARTILGTGFCGGYTTFSAFAYETLALIEEQETELALRVVIVSLVLPALAAALGLAVAAL